MFKSRVFVILMLLSLFACVEEEMDLRGTAPTVKFSFIQKEGDERLMPDSVKFAGTDSTRYYTDTLRTYLLPVDFKQDESRYFFFFGSEVTDVSLFYELEVIDDIDKIRYQANLLVVNSYTIDSLAVICSDTVKCYSNGATIQLFY